jgi:putative transposase
VSGSGSEQERVLEVAQRHSRSACASQRRNQGRCSSGLRFLQQYLRQRQDYPGITKSEELETAFRNTVAEAMKEMGQVSRFSKQFKPTTTVADPSRQVAANLLNRVFNATRPNEKWVADITYLPTSAGWVYLAIVLDLFSRKVVGWSISDNLATTLIIEAIRQAI